MNGYEIPSPNRNLRKVLLLAAAVVVVFILAAVTYYETKVNKPSSSESRAVNFTIAKGQRTRVVADNLAQEKIIGSPDVFIIYSLLHQAGGKLEAGTYALNPNMTIPEIVDVLTHGRVVPSGHTLTIIEGWTNKQIAQDLTSKQIISAPSDFDVALKSNFDFKFATTAQAFSYQGFLFPDTYTISDAGGVNQFIQKTLTNFEGKITDQMLSDISSQHRTLGQVIILASIIEKEVGRNKTTLTADDLQQMQTERGLVASVFYNRLAKGMPLESDATVDYITGKNDRSVSIADTKIKSPYNTYVHTGLPPGPISNPGLGSIMAAIYPTTSNYLYFLNKPDGEAVFAQTLAEHNANKAKYLGP